MTKNEFIARYVIEKARTFEPIEVDILGAIQAARKLEEEVPNIFKNEVK